MTLTEAREIEKQLRNETLTVNRIDYAEAKGFIEGYKAALESDAVTDLVKALTLSMKILREWNAGEPEPDIFMEIDAVLIRFNKHKEARK